jgi:hypothetical protein
LIIPSYRYHYPLTRIVNTSDVQNSISFPTCRDVSKSGSKDTPESSLKVGPTAEFCYKVGDTLTPP